MNILVCEDDKDIQALLGIVIEDMGFQKHECNNHKTLFEQLEKEKINLIIIDYWLGKVKADKIIKELKANHQNIPIVLISAVTDLSELSKTLAVHEFIKKPFNIVDVKNIINKYDPEFSNN